MAAGIHAAGGAAEFMPLDESDARQWQETVTAIVACHGHVDELVNNADILLFKSLRDTSAEEWDRLFNVNVRWP